MKKEWWHNKIAYQIYPKSFCDSNGDGIGDLQGIISKLDYLKELGIDILWISPCYQSPFADQGYDISDYYNIDPIFGSLADIDELIAKAKERNIKILMDLVINHCSDEHRWFQEACKDPEGPYGQYFYIRDYDGKNLPTNWRSYFGGSVWEPLPGHPDKVYLHLFHKKQPDLNWECQALKDELYTMINWWLEKGLGGFRIDAIMNIQKPKVFRSYEADRDDGFCDIFKMMNDAPGIEKKLFELKENTFSKYDAFTVAEVFHQTSDELESFIGDGGCFSTIFDFNATVAGFNELGWYAADKVTTEIYRDACFEAQKTAETIGFMANIIENHDQPRGVSHYLDQDARCPEGKKMLGAFSFFLRGIPFIYQGQEIGMENYPFQSIDEINDVNTFDEYRAALKAGLSVKEAISKVSEYCRDNCRTPMQWSDQAYAGFSTAASWLPVNPNYKDINVEKQDKDQDSILNFYRQMTALRKNPEFEDTFVYGKTIPMFEDRSNLLSYLREGEENKILIIGNNQSKKDIIELPFKCEKILLNNQRDIEFDSKCKILNLKPYQLVIMKVVEE